MTGVPANISAPGGKGAGCMGLVVVACLATIFVGFIVHQCTSPMSRAKRLQKSDPCRAAQMLADEVRRGAMGSSITSLLQLTRMEHPCATLQLIELMSMPHDSRAFGMEHRRLIHRALQQSAGGPENAPPYDPGASADERTVQKEAWREWFAKSYPEWAAHVPSRPATLPADR